jgi:hypothetical protein
MGIAIAALVALMAVSSVALAGRQVRGGHYGGSLRTGNPAPPRITFDVSDGRFVFATKAGTFATIRVRVASAPTAASPARRG